MCFMSTPKPPPIVQQAQAPEPTMPTAKAPLEAKKLKKKKEDTAILPQDAMVSALGIPMSKTSDSVSDYK